MDSFILIFYRNHDNDNGSGKIVMVLQLEIYSDLICPWCYIGKRRLEAAVKLAEGQHTVRVTWHAFQLNPDMPSAGMDRRTYRTAKFGSWERSQKLDTGVAAAGAELGISFNYAAVLRTPNTFDSHRLVWLADQYDLQKIARSLRVTISGGAAMPVEVMLAFNEKFNVKILEGYGLSETSPIAVFNRLDREAKPGSIGLPVWGVEVRVVDQDDQDVGAEEVGEIAIRGHNVMKGYYKRPEATAEAFRNGMSLKDFVASQPTAAYDAKWGDPSLFLKLVYKGGFAHLRELGGVI